MSWKLQGSGQEIRMGRLRLKVQYVFRGTYFQRDIDTVECGGMIDLAR